LAGGQHFKKEYRMAKIKMNKTTTYKGRTYEAGKTYDIELSIADRWNNRGLGQKQAPVKTKSVEPAPEIKAAAKEYLKDHDEPKQYLATPENSNAKTQFKPIKKSTWDSNAR